MASTKPDTVVHSAELGVGALIFGFAGIDSVEHQHKLYTDRVASRTGESLVSTVTNDQFVALCPTIVLDDAQQAREVGARGQRFFGDSIGYWHLGMGDPPTSDIAGDDNIAYMNTRATERAAAYDRGELPQYAERSLAYANFNIDHAYGSVDTAIQYVTELERVGVDEVLCLIQMGTVPQEVCLETIRHWGEEVIPHFRAKRARAGRRRMSRLTGRVALITGAARGQGAAEARAFVGEGAAVVLADVTAEAGEAAAAALGELCSLRAPGCQRRRLLGRGDDCGHRAARPAGHPGQQRRPVLDAPAAAGDRRHAGRDDRGQPARADAGYPVRRTGDGRGWRGFDHQRLLRRGPIRLSGSRGLRHVQVGAARADENGCG